MRSSLSRSPSGPGDRRSEACAATVHCLAAIACSLACSRPVSVPTSITREPVVPPAQVVATAVQTRFVTMEHMIASVEMQLTGEPFAQSLGRVLTGYSRNYLPTNQYFSANGESPGVGSSTDLVGFSTAVESYEYSKQAMNNLAFESGAGSSLVFGPVVNPSVFAGAAAASLLLERTQRFAVASNLGNTLGTWRSGLGTATNPLGWPGLWPVMHPYLSFDPSIAPTSSARDLCSIQTDDSPFDPPAPLLNADYECDANTLHLPDRQAQVEPVITPGASGWADWKQSLWITNYLQIMHDTQGNAIDAVPVAELPDVGQPRNDVVGQVDFVSIDGRHGPAAAAGTYLGSSDIEGFQAAMMITEVDNQLQHWLSTLTTTDGSTLSGFPSILAATQYDFTSPLRWLPAEIAVTETPDASGFPRPEHFQIQSSNSSLLDLAGLLGASSELYALTDLANDAIGGRQSTEAWFDGDPFPADDQLPDGEATLHDRAVAMIRFLVVTLDRLHRDPGTGALVDQVTFHRGVATRGATVATSSVAYSLVALRTARKSLASQVSLYANTTPDTAFESCPLDAVPFAGAPGGASFSQRLNALIEAQASLLLDHLTTAEGFACAGWSFTAGAPTDDSDTLDAHTAAVRGLLSAFLATGDTRYRDRAVAVFERMDSVFYDPSARLYGATPAPVDTVAYTPLRFGLLQGALRVLTELVGEHPGNDALATVLETRLARLNKLVLDGWDDRNLNQIVDWPAECIFVVDGLPRGGLQMAERALTGETGGVNDLLSAAGGRVPSSDRDHDCVPEIDDAHLPAALASELDLRVIRP